MDAQELINILRGITARHEAHANDDDGDKHLSNSSEYAELMGDFLLGDNMEATIRKAKRGGWIDNA